MATADRWEDADYASDVLAARLQGPRPASVLLLLAITAFMVAAYFWAANSIIDEFTRGAGRVIPTSQVQVVQNLEGGILDAILVAEGDAVEAGQVLVRIDDKSAAADFDEKQSRYYTLMGEIARLSAEANDRPLEFAPELLAEAREVAVRERALYDARQAELQSQISILRRQADQRRQEVTELNSRLNRIGESMALAKEELELNQPLADKGIVPKVQMLKLRRQYNDLKGEEAETRLGIPRAQAAIREANQRIEEKILSFRSQATGDLNARTSEFTALGTTISASQDRVTRTEVRSPVKGIVKQLKIRTVGGVVQPGQDIVEIVPIEDGLLVEAQVRPADIAFIRPGQKATVKLTAYDYSIYGGLEGTVDRIGADTIVDDEGNSFYKIAVRTEKTYLQRGEQRLPIIPGMVASVDILTGKKSILDYLLKPILKARDNALRER
ncbi:HlyD family type I secretion periplasmic adaptor subunit [Oceanibacterium hippocampi]|uniref:Membrane fusion protein (MFP) family protein n=1 Tax=Oceanibacterium hippocampi TaxID=745714 RepID=A0A1Y5RYC1_9PROT|nr:HlyD family type I secretion periplasmic adaptor subunit [Oceanibacterium hippocampi]SLN28196.1 Type I secretion system membrane fusion protein PrsE [Oceanibacterium hippocampi]